MKASFFATLFTFCLAAPAFASPVSALAFMGGCWEAPDGQNGQDTRVETWGIRDGGSLVGEVTTHVQPGEEAGDNFSEEIHLDQASGTTVYTATMPEPGNPQNVFALTSSSTSEAVFTMTSSYSNKIKALVVTYSASSDDELRVKFEVTLANGTKLQPYGYTYQKISCPFRR